jgi:hypothetical protein
MRKTRSKNLCPVPFKSEARRFLEKTARPLCCESPLKLQHYLVHLLAILKHIAKAHTDLLAAFHLLHTAAGNGAMKFFLKYII